MRSVEDTRQRWHTLFRKCDTPSRLRSELRSEEGDKLCNDGLRSICWKAFLVFDNLDRTQWHRRITESRSAYTALKVHFLKYIDHPDDLQSTIDPLADDEESPWQTLRDDEQMREEISQDVDRCLQENFFFREPATKAKMIDILFIYAKLNPDLGYRQGMHELLAPILWVVDRDTIDPKTLEGSTSTKEDDNLMLQLLDAHYVEHDSFGLFCSVMQSTRVYYEHHKERSANGQTEVIPIVNQCQHIHQDLLMTADLELADHLQVLEILPQIFLTRWMRLLFGREFPFQEVLALWDLLFAEGLRLELVEFVCVAMLLRIRWKLLTADYSSALTILLRYPSPHPHAPQSFVHDGLYLEQNPTPERGSFIISKYSGKPPDSSKPVSKSSGRSLSISRFHRLSQTNSPSRSPARNSPKSFEAILQDVSKGFQRRTESWGGVAKAVQGAVSEAKRNMQAIQSENLRATINEDVPSAHTAAAPRSQESDRVVNLKARIVDLEERNKMLAKTLSQALDEMRTHIEGQDTGPADAMKQALAKIQSVQTCLEGPSAALDPSGQSEEADVDPVENNIPDEPKSIENRVGEVGNDEVPQPSPTVTDRAHIVTKPPSSSGEGEAKTSVATTTTDIKMPTPMPSRLGARSSLANSEFSWMLGGNRHISSFVSPASVPPEQTRHDEMRTKQQALFGNGHEEQKRRPSSEPDGLALRSLRSPQGSE